MVQLLLHFALPLKQRVHFVVRHRFAKFGVDRFKLFQQIDSLSTASSTTSRTVRESSINGSCSK